MHQQTHKAALWDEADRGGYMGAGDNFSYTEAMEVPGPVVAGLGSTVLGLIYVVLSLRFLRPLVMKVLPAPGQGPSEKQQVEGFWCVAAFALQTIPEDPHMCMVGETPCNARRNCMPSQTLCTEVLPAPEELQMIESSCGVCTARLPLLRQSSGIFQA